jgi:hypothetical protein
MAASSTSTLLWVHYDDDPTRPKSHELSATIKQHVMVNYYSQRAKQVQETKVVRRSSRAKAQSLQTTFVTTRGNQTTVSSRDASSSKLKQTHFVLAKIPSPAPGLISDEYRGIYNAIWWHRYAPLDLPEPDETHWSQKYRTVASELLWKLATEDKTFFEIFMTFSAAKEIAVKGSRDLRAYFRYKGRAIAMVSQDVNRKSLLLGCIAEVLSLAQVKVSLCE